MAKYRIPVGIQAWAGKTIGVVECDTLEEFKDKSEALWEAQGWTSPSTNIHNDFEVDGDWELSPVEEGDLKYYKDEAS